MVSRIDARAEDIERGLISGNGDFIHHIDKKALGLTGDELEAEIAEYRKIAEKRSCSFAVLSKNEASAHILIRRIPKSVEDSPEVRVAVVGNVDAGKSTLLGVLTRGVLDDGRGLARSHVFRHRHESDTGRTSSIGSEILGFGDEGKAVYPTSSGSQKVAWDQVCSASHRLVGFIDLAGHEKYLKTTMFGLTGCSPDYSLLVVGANAGIIGMAREHLTLSFALSIPVIIAVSKTDMCPPPVLEETMRQLFRLLKGPACRRVPVLVKSTEEAVITAGKMVSQRLCPIIQVSSVNGQGVDILRLMMNILPLPEKQQNTEPDTPSELEIIETFVVPGVGTVVSGTMIAGTLTVGQTVWLGPDSLGSWLQTQIKGIHRKRITVSEARPGQSVSLALKKLKRSQIHKGMVILSADPTKITGNVSVGACREFEAEVIILFHSTTISPRYQAMLHSGVIRQTVTILSITPTASSDDSSKKDALRTGDRARVRFRFIRHPEYMRVGARLVFREGRSKGVGRVTAIFQ